MGEQEFIDDEIIDNNTEETLDIQDAETEEYEEIDSDEVDRVVTALEAIANSTDSENIRHLIEEASNSIYYLVYSEDEDEEDEVLEEAA